MVTVVVDAAGLAPGTYGGVVTLSAPNFNDASVPVSLIVEAAGPFVGGVTVELAPAQVSTVAGDGSAAVTDGVGLSASFGDPGLVEVNDQFVFVADGTSIRRMDRVTGAVETWVGDPTFRGRRVWTTQIRRWLGLGTSRRWRSMSGPCSCWIRVTIRITGVSGWWTWRRGRFRRC